MEGLGISVKEDGTILVSSGEDFPAGEYTMVITLGGSRYTVTAEVTAPVQPETPETSESPEAPEDSENDSNS